MKIEKIVYDSFNNEHRIYAWLMYDEDKEIKGVVQIAHGMKEYFLRYREFGEFLVENGYAVCGNDHIGHGLSVVNSLGYMGGNVTRTMAEDAHGLFKKIKPRFEGKPYFLLGHSMGSFVARLYASKWAYELDGIILSGTGEVNILTRTAFKLFLPVVDLIVEARGLDARAFIFEKFNFGAFRKVFEPEESAASWQTSDSVKAQEFVDDPKCSFCFTYAAYRDIAKCMLFASSKKWAYMLPEKLPLLLFSGDKDPVGSFGKGVGALYNKLKRAGIADVNMNLYKNGRHEMLNEVNRQAVYADVLNWLDERALF